MLPTVLLVLLLQSGLECQSLQDHRSLKSKDNALNEVPCFSKEPDASMIGLDLITVKET